MHKIQHRPGKTWLYMTVVLAAFLLSTGGYTANAMEIKGYYSCDHGGVLTGTSCGVMNFKAPAVFQTETKTYFCHGTGWTIIERNCVKSLQNPKPRWHTVSDNGPFETGGGYVVCLNGATLSQGQCWTSPIITIKMLP